MNNTTVTRLHLVRHGETEENQRGILVGSTDVALCENGRVQARDLAGLTRSLPLDAIFVSPMLRTVETAILAFGPQARLVTDSRLKECHFGEWEGLYFAEIAGRYPEVWQNWLRDWEHTPIPGGETFALFSQRLVAFCEEILHKHPGQNLALVTHGGCIRTLLSHYLCGSAGGGNWKFKVENATMTTLEFAEGFPILTAFNWRG